MLDTLVSSSLDEFVDAVVPSDIRRDKGLANASLLDAATAAAEAMTLMQRMSKVKNNVFIADYRVHPQTLAVLNCLVLSWRLEIAAWDWTVSIFAYWCYILIPRVRLA